MTDMKKLLTIVALAIAALPLAAQETYDAMVSLTQKDEKLTMAEKIYLQMAAQKLGIH